jgi:hypothetical protein
MSPPTMSVTVPTLGLGRPVVVAIRLTCRRCGFPRGRAVPHPVNAALSTWRNPCGHTDTYAEVLAEARELAAATEGGQQ